MSQPDCDDQLAALLAAPVPRQVPGKVRRAAKKQAASIFTIIFGLGYGFIMPYLMDGYFVWSVGPDLLLNGAKTHAQGRVSEVTKTNYSEGKGHLDASVFAYKFSFVPTSAAEADSPTDPTAAGNGAGSAHPVMNGVSYTTGKNWSKGALVDIEYLGVFPSVSRIAGSRTTRSSFSWFIGLFGLLIGLGIAAPAFVLRRRAGWLLVHGTCGEAKVWSVETTGVAINKRRVYAIRLQPTGSKSNEPVILRRTNEDLIKFFQTRLAAKQTVFMLYNPSKPKRAVFPESLRLRR